MRLSEDSMYKIENDESIPIKIKVEEMEWLLRYGDEQEIIKHRFYIAHIVSLYKNNEDN